jgi:hypothetical protein
MVDAWLAELIGVCECFLQRDFHCKGDAMDVDSHVRPLEGFVIIN